MGYKSSILGYPPSTQPLICVIVKLRQLGRFTARGTLWSVNSLLLTRAREIVSIPGKTGGYVPFILDFPMKNNEFPWFVGDFLITTRG